MYPITEEYLAILKKFKKIGYEARSFHNFSKLKSHLLLRHDVDVSIERAYEIAKIENNFGVDLYSYKMGLPYSRLAFAVPNRIWAAENIWNSILNN